MTEQMEIDNMDYSSRTSQKFRNFVSEPISNKPVTSLAGIGPVLGNRLEDLGYDKAYMVLGQFLLLKKNEKQFQDWLKNKIKANTKQASDCNRCIKEWCEEFL